MEIRRIEQRDIGQLTDIEDRIFSAEAWTGDDFELALTQPGQYFITACEDGKVLGYAGMWVVLDEAQIMNVAVDVPYRRRGIARELMNALIAEGRRRAVTVFQLEVRMGNEPAQKLYSSLGFKPVGVRKAYYRLPVEDALLMDYMPGRD